MKKEKSPKNDTTKIKKSQGTKTTKVAAEKKQVKRKISAQKKETKIAAPPAKKTIKSASKPKVKGVGTKTVVLKEAPDKVIPPLKPEKEKITPPQKPLPPDRKKEEPTVFPGPLKSKEISQGKKTVIEETAATTSVPPAPSVPERVPPRAKIRISESTTVKSLAESLQIKVVDLIKKLLGMGMLVTINQKLDVDTATLVAGEFGYDTEFVSIYAEEILTEDEKKYPVTYIPRIPVVTVMGHVDHGKTTLLDAIRKTDVAGSEFGGITQHIGAYRVKTKDGEITFIDTPGHEAFTAMRSRGAQVTDLVVLVVAADDGVMPQTVEAIDHARAAGVPIVVAINKVDSPKAQPQRVMQELTKYNLIAEEWGGETVMVEVSAKTGHNVDKLLELILLRAQMLDLKAPVGCPAQGIVLEGKLDQRRGPVATIIIKKGVLKIGAAFVSGFTYGKVRAISTERGQREQQANAGSAVELLGFNQPPQTGDILQIVENERTAREIVSRRQQRLQQEQLHRQKSLRLDVLSQKLKEGHIQELRLILKADVQGSLEALRDAFEHFSTEKVGLRVIHAGVGAVNISDVNLAVASEAVIISFNVRPDSTANRLAEQEGVDIRTYRVIYEAIADIRAALEGLLEPEMREVTLGRAEIREIFRVPDIGNVAGCYVTEGKTVRGARFRLLRDNVIIYEGEVTSLRRFKEDVREVDKNYECGVGLANFQDIQKGDQLEFYTLEKYKPKLFST